MTNSKYLSCVGVLVPFLLLGCGGGGDKDKKPMWPTAYSWGSYGWTSESGSEMRVSLTRLIEGEKRVLLTRMELKDKDGCQAFTMRRSEDEPLVLGAFNFDWLVVLPREKPEPCGQIKTSVLQFRDTRLRNEFSTHKIISSENMAANPQIPLALALGTRSMIVVPQESGRHYLPPLAAIWDLELNKFVGLALQGNWSKDKTSEASFKAPASDKYYQEYLFERDEVDKEWMKKWRLLDCMFARPSSQSKNERIFAQENLMRIVEQILAGKGNCP